jgi:LacI family transcriptional regulator
MVYPKRFEACIVTIATTPAEPKIMQVTLKDIAEASGYSITTVSRALAGYDDVNEQTRAHIRVIAKRMGYHPNVVARQLQSQRTQTIGMIIPATLTGYEDDFFSLLLKGVTHAATRRHYDVLVSAQLHETDAMDAYRRIAGGRRVDGLILARTHRHDPRIQYLQEINHPFVVSGRASPGQLSDFPYIDADSQYGIRLLVDHFVSYGHRHIGLILPPEDIAYTPYRLNGYKHGLDEAGIAFDPNAVIHGDLTRKGGCKAMLELLHRTPHLTAVIACNDLMALGAITAISQSGLTVGDDVAVGGFDDLPLAEHAQPSLTTVRQPIYEIGEQLTDLLIRIIDGKTVNEPGKLLNPTLIIRESSGKPR